MGIERAKPQNQIEQPPTLAELGIHKKQSERWQTIASLPERVFEAHIAEVKEELTADFLADGEKSRRWHRKRLDL